MLRVATCLLFGLLISCSSQPSRPQSKPIGEAFVGPASLNLRQELTPKAAVSATVKHGDKLDILENKRRFVRVRAPDGKEGWADTRQLLMPDQMTALRAMAESAAHDPSHGSATVFDSLNMHTEPNRTSPSFWQIPENTHVDVIAHKLSPRVGPVQPSAPPPVRKARPSRKKGKGSTSAPSKSTPPPPQAPKPPENWLELSVPKEEDIEPVKPVEKGVEPPAPIPMDDWSLVRTKDGKVGWVLTRALIMAIPDEVAQYAEGHRITSYFALGDVQDGDTVKKNWLWTTITKGQLPYEFDSFRVFVWSRKRHRYETAYIERKLVGHFPVHVDISGESPSFSVVVEADAGRLVRKTYAFGGYHIRLVKKEPIEKESKTQAPPATASAAAPAPAKESSWFEKTKDRVKGWFH